MVSRDNATGLGDPQQVVRTGLQRQAPGLAVAVLAVTVSAALGSLALETANGDATDNTGGWSALPVLLALLTIPAVGALLAARRPGCPIGWLALGAPFCVFVALLGHAWAVHALRVSEPAAPGGRPAAWVATWLFTLGLGLGPFLLATFPSGSPADWLRWPSRVAGVALVLLCAAQAVAADDLDGVSRTVRPIPNPLGVDALSGPVSVVTGAAVVCLVVLFLLALASLVTRALRGAPEERRKLRWLVLSLALLPIGAVGAALTAGVAGEHAADVVQAVTQLGAIVGGAFALAHGVLVGDLFELRDYARRAGVGAALSALILIGFVATVSIVATVTSASGAAPPAVAAAVVALALGPLRGRLQRGVDRLLYGWRSEPYRVLSDLGSRLEESPTADAALPAVVETVATGLRLPFVRIDLDAGDGPVTVAVTGSPVEHIEAFPLVDGDRHLGELVVGRRSADEPFQAAETALLRNLARSASAVASSVLLTTELRNARARLVRSREDERRRLQRELHDGVGPALAGLGLQLDAVVELMGADPDAASDLLASMRRSLTATSQEVRRIAHDLRPAVLDELGLLEAIREQARFLTASAARPLELDLDLTSSADAPAAVQVAVYRIASEALANVVKHAQATNCSVRLFVNGSVELDVADNGIGCSAEGSEEGVGLRSMRDRAAELGGCMTVTPRRPSGTLIQLRLPSSA